MPLNSKGILVSGVTVIISNKQANDLATFIEQYAKAVSLKGIDVPLTLTILVARENLVKYITALTVKEDELP